MSPKPTPENKPQTAVSLRDPILAGVLAFLVPGLGHLYQGRMFKAALYAICILGTFFTGLRIGHGQVVYFQWEDTENRTYAYLCQVWTGLPALPALAQAKLRHSRCFDEGYLANDLTASFVGYVDDVPGEFRGTLTIPAEAVNSGTGAAATFTGKQVTPQGERDVKATLTHCAIDPQVGPDFRRGVMGYFESQSTADHTIAGRIVGSVPRPLWDWYEAPLFDANPPRPSALNKAHRELGSRFELGVVYTMIAGLLNVLAIFDAMYGPAYGDEKQHGSDPSQKPQTSGPAPVPPAK